MSNLTKVTITINQPVEKVWELFMNPDNLKNWLTGFVSVEPISGNTGEPGSVSKLKFMERGKLVEVTETVMAAMPNQQYSFEMEHEAFHAKTDVRLVSFGTRTEFIQTVEFFPKGFMMKLMMPIVKGAMKKQMLNELNNLKNFIETKY
ncbi:MAG TPA: SRPBCC family protein [Chitinophagaceae bacterium]